MRHRNPGVRRLPILAAVGVVAAMLAGCAGMRSDSADQARAILEQPAPAPAESAIPAVEPRLPPMAASARLREGARLKGFAPATWGSLPVWQADDLSVVWTAFLRNCQAVLERGLASGRNSAVVAAGPWRDVCVAAFNAGAKVDAVNQPDSVRQFLQTWLQPWQVMAAGKPAVNTVTGYYEPLVRAARTRHGPYQWPLYAVPSDMLVIDLGSAYPELAGKRVRGKLDGRRVVPYDTRAEIDRPGRQPEALVWVDDPVDAFFLQVQGSGRAQLSDGVVRLAYADQNGHQYASIGRWLVDQGELTLAQASMQNIRAWARRNPDRVREMLNVNPSVVFFQEEPVSKAGEGPRGAFNVPLTSQHSIAVDPQFVPLGSPVILATTYPGSSEPLNRLVFAQDTGSAIKGAGRADFYWGFGEEAGAMAGRMKQNGRMWVLWPKAAGAPAADR